MKGGKLPKQFESEEKCVAFLEALRWPEGVTCPKCANTRISRFQTSGKTGKTRQLYQCLSCRYQFSVRTGTIFHDSHLPLQKWFTAMALVGESGGTISANQLRQALGVQYKTAWQLGNRLREAMQQSVQQTIEEDAGNLPKAGSGHSERMAPWERRVLLRFLDSTGRPGAGPVAVSHATTKPVKSTPAATNRIALVSPASRVQQKPSVPANGAYTGIQDSVENILGFWKREVIDSFPVVGARHIPGYMNEMTFLFGKMFFSAMRDALLVMPRLAGIEPERWYTSGPEKGRRNG